MKAKSKFGVYFALTVLQLCASSPLFADQSRLVLSGLSQGKLTCASFELSADAEIDIQAKGALGQYSEELTGYCWILDSKTRGEIWHFTSHQRSKDAGKKDNIQEYEGAIPLKKGIYEVYYYVPEYNFFNINIDGTNEVFDFLRDLFSRKSKTNWKESISELMIEIRSNANVFKIVSQGSAFKPSPPEPPLFQKVKLGDGYYKKSYFRLKEPTNLRIYMIGEYSQSGKRLIDGAWVVDAETGAHVWEPTRWNTELAGGARKNRMFYDDVHLPAGDYIINCITDDSHSFEGWNANPPSDPYFWGISIFPGQGYKSGQFIPLDAPIISHALLKIIRVGEDAAEEQSFKLSREARLRIYCFGEFDESGEEFADFGWIEDNATGEIVWQLDAENAQFGGGSSKNRVFDGVITLPKGSYTVHYISDDSHSYNDWTTSPPFDPENYGISIYGVGKDFDPAICELTPKSDFGDNTLVEMTRLGDDQRVFKNFTIQAPSKIHIYSIGEGDRDEMYDYGWIERKKDNQVVWEMTYRNTKPAGGASKNRLFDGEILLDKGEYTARFSTDGSHSYNNWNAPKPKNPTNWGILITKP
ncbi:MAG: hypothetical protein CO189_07315 [candidate division Zixibacteria bacterium CG_4_9_14_3_um_filter_46_8]|nr:MAG: hypothetical protein CO189_07315 [candidate division Zixibacteria bacterium CG_4_9_14_3_um_filter_46_8]